MKNDKAKQLSAMLCKFIARNQVMAMCDIAKGEEGPAMKAIIGQLAARVETMPATYGQDGVKDPIVYLHYFVGGCDWYITEKDCEDEQIQAFGYADLGYGPEMGYICIAELIENGVEIDLYWTPKPWSQVAAAKAAA